MRNFLKMVINRIKSSEPGSVMITAMFMMLLLVTTVTGLATLSVSQTQIVDLQKKSSKALQIADAGLNHAMLRIREGNTQGFSADYGGGSYTVTISNPSPTIDPEHYKIRSTGEIAGEASRTVEVSALDYSFWDFGFSGSPITEVKGNARIIGSLFVNSDLTIDKGNAGVERGPLFIKQDISLGNNNYIGGTRPGGSWNSDPPITLFLEGTRSETGYYSISEEYDWVPDISMPEIDIEELEQMAEDNSNTVRNGNLTLGRNSVSFGNFSYTVAKKPEPELIRTITTSAYGNLSTPVATASDANGNLYVLERGANRVLKYTSTYAYETSWDGFSSPNGIAVDTRNGDGTLTQYVYVSDTNNNVVKKYDESGSYITSFGSGTLSSPLGIAVDTSSYVYVADYSNNMTRKFDSGGTLIASATTTEPRGVAVGPDGDIYVSGKTFTSGSGKYGIFRLRSSDLYELEKSGGGVNFNDPKNIAVDDKVYVAVRGDNKVSTVPTSSMNADTNFITGLNSPEGTSFDLSGNLYVSNTGSNEVRIYKLTDANLSLDGVAYINGDFNIKRYDIVYSLGAQGGTIVVNGDIKIERKFRPNPVDDTTETNFRLVDAIGLITPKTIFAKNPSGDSYSQPSLVALMYGGEKITFSGPFTFRGVFASDLLEFDGVPAVYIQRPENMPPGVPGAEPQIYTGGWREID